MRLVLLHFANADQAAIEKSIAALGATRHHSVAGSWIFSTECPSIQIGFAREWPLDSTLKSKIHDTLGKEATTTLELCVSTTARAEIVANFVLDIFAIHPGFASIELREPLWNGESIAANFSAFEDALQLREGAV